MIMKRALQTIVLLTAVAGGGGNVLAAGDVEGSPAALLRLELNRLDQNGEACRFTFLVMNGLPADLAEMSAEIVLFDSKGLVERMTSVNFGVLGKDRTLVKRFDLPALSCAGVSRILVNGIGKCAGAGLDAGACASGLQTDNRTSIPFGR